MADLRVLKIVGLAIILFLTISLLVPARAASAQPPIAPPMQTPTPEPNPITQIINQIIQFPFENLTQALQNALQSILTNSVAPLESIFSASIGRWLTSSPGIVTPGGGIANGGDVMGPAWRLMIKIAVLLWPLTLAIIAAIAAKDAVAAASWGIGDLKEALGGWLIAVVASATSLYWMDLANRFTNGTTMAILNMSFTGEAGFQPNALTGLVFGTAGLLLAQFAPPASLFIVIFVILLGLAVLTALIFQFMARFVVLYVLVALAPVVMILGVLPPMRWFSYTWLRGFVLVEAVGPINALLLKLVMILTVRGNSNDPITAFVDFLGALGVLSILLTIDGVIIKTVFGAVQEVAEKAMSTVVGIATLALAGATALAGGSIAAAGGVAAAGSAAGGAAGGGTGGAGGGAGGAALASAGGNSNGPAQAARKAFSPGTALRGAGDVLFRQPGVLGSMGAAMRSLGGTMEQHDRDSQAEARLQTSQAARTNATQAVNRSVQRNGGSQGGTARGGNQPASPLAPTRSAASTGQMPSGPANSSQLPASAAPVASATIRPSPNGPLTPANPAGSGGNTNPSAPGVAALGGTQSPVSPASAPPVPPVVSARASADLNAGVAGSSGAAVPPSQMPSVSPMGEPLRPPATIASGALSPDVASTLSILPAPLRDRGASLAQQYAGPDQAAAARAAVESLSALEFKGQFSNPAALASAWDRGMAPVMASAREGLPLATMAQDAGFGANISGYITQRMTQPSAQRLEPQSQSVPWHPQLAPHDWETGIAISQAIGSGTLKPGTAARLYHEIRSPESGGGWSAGAQFIQTIQEALHGRPTDPITVLNARLSEMELRGQVSASAMALWRANVRSEK